MLKILADESWNYEYILKLTSLYFSLALVNQFQSDSHVCLGLFILFFMGGF